MGEELSNYLRNLSMISVHDLAGYIVQWHLKWGEPDVNTMKLHKLSYLCQAYSLAWRGERMFSEDIRAATSGPIVDELFQHHKGLYGASSWPEGSPANLSEADRIVADSVMKTYRAWTGLSMSNMLLETYPWEKTWEKHTDEDPTPVFDLTMVKGYYMALSDAPKTREEYAVRFMDKYLEQSEK